MRSVASGNSQTNLLWPFYISKPLVPNTSSIKVQVNKNLELKKIYKFILIIKKKNLLLFLVNS